MEQNLFKGTKKWAREPKWPMEHKTGKGIKNVQENKIGQGDKNVLISQNEVLKVILCGTSWH